jgi:hypothetical protein
VHLQLAMDRHRLGPKYGIPVESMCFTKVQLYGDPNLEYTIKNLLSVDPRIISGQLCLRIQQWALFCAIIPPDSAIVGFLKVCTHEYMVRLDSHPLLNANWNNLLAQIHIV